MSSEQQPQTHEMSQEQKEKLEQFERELSQAVESIAKSQRRIEILVIMKNKIIMLSGLFCICAVALTFVFLKNSDSVSMPTNEQVTLEKIRIAACPTCYKLTQKLDTEKYQVIPTSSTAESVQLIKNNQADLMLAGRTLKTHEPLMENIVIGTGYSFISNKDFSVYIGELKNYNIYTDLDIESVKKDFLVAKIEKVEDVYQYLNKGIIITSWENTDYTKAEIVHIMEETGQRVRLSRQPTIYCPKFCGADVQELALLLK